MTQIIQQRTPHDCAVAAMAMLTGKTWEETHAIIGHLVDYEGERRGMRDEQQALKLLGFDYRFENGRPVGDISCMRRPFGIAADFYRQFAWGRRALMSVPSLNRPGGWHMIFWDGARVYDPSPLKTYSKFDELLPDELVLFRESPAAPCA